MNNIIYFDQVLRDASEKKKQMAQALEELEKMGCLSEEYIVYALKFVTLEQLKYILNLIKLLLKS
ncbi:MAG: hypothetical protein J6C55_01125 [Oscillospiraceae bacterium]|nr:hypothetical protein [Oscillospiraceae bacterium]